MDSQGKRRQKILSNAIMHLVSLKYICAVVCFFFLTKKYLQKLSIRECILFTMKSVCSLKPYIIEKFSYSLKGTQKLLTIRSEYDRCNTSTDRRDDLS